MNSFSNRQKAGEGRRQTKMLLTLVVVFIAVQVSQCFAPLELRKTVSQQRSQNFSLQQQLTQVDPSKNEGGEIEIDMSLSSNSTEHFGTLNPRKDDAVQYVNGIFKRGVPSLKLPKTMIESTVDDMLKPSIKSMGLFGETIQEEPMHGPVLAASSQSNVVARLATSMNDFAIANLRLSVFSNFNPDSRKIFCERSCQLLASRRRRGATCVVATLDKKKRNKRRTIRNKDVGPIVGTAEASFHEFAGTTLGRSRPKDSILYVTEVAVDASQRRKGIAKLLMEAIDNLAKTRQIETIYLHVDVTNEGAVNLYKRAGYRQLEADNPMFLEFTTKLNLHDGATKGRNHYLMCRDLTRSPTWFQIPEEEQLLEDTPNSQQRTLQQRTFGIDVMSTV